jgi:hypothetical protein
MTMKIEGETAKNWQAVRIDSYATVNLGDLVSADDKTGEVEWLDRTGTVAKVALGPHTIRLMPRHSYGR